MSSGDGTAAPSSIRTLHFLQVPWPPQVESIAIPFQLAASNTLTPAGTRTWRPEGSNRRSTRTGCRPLPAGRAGRRRVGVMGEYAVVVFVAAN